MWLQHYPRLKREYFSFSSEYPTYASVDNQHPEWYVYDKFFENLKPDAHA